MTVLTAVSRISGVIMPNAPIASTRRVHQVVVQRAWLSIAIASRINAGAMLVPDKDRIHAGQILHRRRPVHVAVAHQRELGIDAFGGEGLRQRFIDRHVVHGGVLSDREIARAG